MKQSSFLAINLLLLLLLLLIIINNYNNITNNSNNNVMKKEICIYIVVNIYCINQADIIEKIQ